MLEDLDYFSLLKKAKRCEEGEAYKIAILSDGASQQLAKVLQGYFSDSRIQLDIYEAPIGSIDLEIMNPDSDLYQSRPDTVLIYSTEQALRNKFYHNKKNFFSQEKELIEQRLEKLRENFSGLLIVSNYSLPMERVAGNFDLNYQESFRFQLQSLNSALSQLVFKNHGQLLDIERLSAVKGLENWYDEKLWVHSKTPCQLMQLPFIAREVKQICHVSQGKMIKCVISDLDGTMWGGIIGDDGPEGIGVGEVDEGEAFDHYQHYLKQLKERGILLAVCSKNDEEIALSAFRENEEMVLKEDDFAVFIANWENKADNIKTIQEVLNIGFDSMVFIDDNPFERNLVRNYLPEVIVPELPEDPALYVQYLSEQGLFETQSISGEDQTRTELYRVESKRRKQEQDFRSIDDFLISLEMQGEKERFNTANLPRITQLIQRSNQFNLTTIRHSLETCEQFAGKQDVLPFYFKLRDKFGDYGLISLVIGIPEDDVLILDTWLMSCRVLKRGVEDWAMNTIIEEASKKGLRTIRGVYRPSKKNLMVKDFYSRYDFKLVKESERESFWELSIKNYKTKKHFISGV